MTTLTAKKIDEVYNRYDVANTIEGYKPRYNIRPGENAPVITSDGSKNFIQYMYWTLIPPYSKEKRLKFSTINAKDENLLTSNLWRNPFKKYRGIVPVDGFYEPDKTKTPSIPYYFHLKDNSIFSLGVIYSPWHDPETNTTIFTYAIVTTKPNEIVSAMHHDRMPLRLSRQEESVWLNPSTPIDQLLALLHPSPSDDMTGYEVGQAVKNPRNEGPDLIKPVSKPIDLFK